jgi:hypothetical protein
MYIKEYKERGEKASKSSITPARYPWLPVEPDPPEPE